MLTVSQIKNLGYCLDVSSSEYYTKGGEPKGVWIGSASNLLNLDTCVAKQDFENIMNGYTQDKKHSLCQNPGVERQYGWDLTFSAPKSVSCLWAAANMQLKRQIEHGQFLAVSKVFGFIEDNIVKTRRGTAGHHKENVMGLLGATFSHCTSREQDPQLHTHCLIPNVSVRKDGSWGAIDSIDFYLWQKALGVIYRSELANELMKLGFTIENCDEAFSVKGISKKVCEHFSKRGTVIKEELEKHGLNSTACPKGDIIALATRSSKKEVHRVSLFKQWANEFDDLGVDRDLLVNNALLKGGCIQVEKALDEQLLSSLTETRSTFRTQDLIYEVGKQSQSLNHNVNDIISKSNIILSKATVVHLGKDHLGNNIFSTKEIINKELHLVKVAKELAASERFYINNSVINNVLSKEMFVLSYEQIEAINHVTAKGSFSILQGSAGAGKSTSMSSVAKAYETEGYKVFGAAVAKSASKNLENETGISSFTIAMLELELNRKPHLLNDKSVLIVDEAGQLGVNTMDWLLKTAKSKGFKLILVGEDKQLDAIEKGGSLKYLSRSEVIGTTRVEAIRRQKHNWARIVVALLRDGKADVALNQLYQKDKITFSENSDIAKELLVSSWINNHNNIDGRVILAQRWNDVIDINKRIRSKLIEKKQIKNTGFCFESIVNNRIFETEMSVGDRIRLTKNDYSLGLTNGDVGIVRSIDVNSAGGYLLAIELDDGKRVLVDTSEYRNEQGQVYIVHAYAMTVYASQGITIKGDSFVYYTKGMDRANSYVACSRHTDNCHLFVSDSEISDGSISNDKDRLRSLSQLMSKDSHKVLAIEHIEANLIARNSEFEKNELELS